MATASKQIARKADLELAELLPFVCHGSIRLPAVTVDSYNVEMREDRKFVGDRANKKAFTSLVDKWRRIAEEQGHDPFHGIKKRKLSRKQIEQALVAGSTDAAGVVQAALDEFSGQLADVIESYLEIAEWKKVSAIFIGGGMRASRPGEIAIGRARAILYKRKIKVDLRPIHADPDKAGLIGAAYLAPPWIFAGYNGLLAVDIGGTNIRAGIATLHGAGKSAFPKVKVAKSSTWEHAKDEPKRDEAIEHLLAMLRKLVHWAKGNKLRLAPFVGIGCPGRIRIDGAIDRGAQNLPGNWEADRFNLPAQIAAHLSVAPGQETVVVLHNDAVLQGLSDLRRLRGAREWAVLTIGTGLGNAKFTTRSGADRA